MPVSGQSIRLAFGENGELLSLNTQWRSLTEIDQVPVISPRKAIEKIQQGEVFNDHYHPGYVRIDKIYLGYYAAYPERQEEILEPVWIFSGKKIPVWTFSGENDYEDYGFSVDARVSGSSLQFANFTASTTSGPVPLTVIFNDTSTGPIDLWAWDFGDGTSTNWTQNPVHTDLKEGKYTVKLLAFDEERDDTLTKADYITVTSPP
jgi:PKD repeat protein